ncbi:MAG: hypothetical protein AAB839_00920 [Patescibacteria group bacterium]
MAKKSSLVGYLILVVIFVVGVVGTVRFMSDQPEASDTNNEGQVTVVENDTAVDVTTNDFVMPDAWPQKGKMTGYLANLTPNQEIQFGIVNDPVDEQIVYFATTAPMTVNGEEKTLLSIYKANATTYDYERMYRATYGQGETPGLRSGDDGAWPVWHVVGYDQGKLVILVQDADDSPGICAEIFVIGVDGEAQERAYFAALDVANPAAGLADYMPDAQAVADARAKELACQAEL